MVKEYLFARVEFDEHSGNVLCAKCGRRMNNFEIARRTPSAGGLVWACEQCACMRFNEAEIVGTMREAILL